MEVLCGFRATVVTAECQHGTPGTVSIGNGMEPGTALVVIGIQSEEPTPRLMLQLNAAERTALRLALDAWEQGR